MRSVTTLDLSKYKFIEFNDSFGTLNPIDNGNREMVISYNNITSDKYYVWVKSSFNHGVDWAFVEGECITYET